MRERNKYEQLLDYGVVDRLKFNGRNRTWDSSLRCGSWVLNAATAGGCCYHNPPHRVSGSNEPYDVDDAGMPQCWDTNRQLQNCAEDECPRPAEDQS